jgi:hypothetical protein
MLVLDIFVQLFIHESFLFSYLSTRAWRNLASVRDSEVVKKVYIRRWLQLFKVCNW